MGLLICVWRAGSLRLYCWREPWRKAGCDVPRGIGCQFEPPCWLSNRHKAVVYVSIENRLTNSQFESVDNRLSRFIITRQRQRAKYEERSDDVGYVRDSAYY